MSLPFSFLLCKYFIVDLLLLQDIIQYPVIALATYNFLVNVDHALAHLMFSISSLALSSLPLLHY
jgi:hypothetical protein